MRQEGLINWASMKERMRKTKCASSVTACHIRLLYLDANIWHIKRTHSYSDNVINDVGNGVAHTQTTKIRARRVCQTVGSQPYAYRSDWGLGRSSTQSPCGGPWHPRPPLPQGPGAGALGFSRVLDDRVQRVQPTIPLPCRTAHHRPALALPGWPARALT
jgi:hypothetical protein